MAPASVNSFTEHMSVKAGFTLAVRTGVMVASAELLPSLGSSSSTVELPMVSWALIVAVTVSGVPWVLSPTVAPTVSVAEASLARLPTDQTPVVEL